MCTTLWYRAPELLYGAKFYGPPIGERSAKGGGEAERQKGREAERQRGRVAERQQTASTCCFFGCRISVSHPPCRATSVDQFWLELRAGAAASGQARPWTSGALAA